MKKKIIIAGIVAAVAGAVIAGGWVVHSRLGGGMSYTGTIAARVGSKVVMEHDGAGIPQVQAVDIGDACFGLGYLHAQDRYAVMEHFRAVATGATGDTIARDGAVIDRLSRGIGFARRAREMTPRIRSPYRDYLAAYVRGVNEARKRLGLSDTVAREWTPEDCVAILLLREWANAFLDNREILFPLPREDTGDLVRSIVPAGLISYYTENEADSVEVLRRLRDIVGRHIGTFNRGYALFMPAQRMKDRYPITAYSFEDGISLYPGWYPVHIRTDDRIIKGVTHAGLPFVFAGTNLYISFFGFAAGFDVQDFIAETIIRVGDVYQYLGAAGWRDFDTVKDDAGGAPGKRIRLSENGPILNDILGGADTGAAVVTVRSSFPGEGYIESLFDIPFAKSIEEAAARIARVASPPRVYLFASDEKAIRSWSGMVPLRKERDDGDSMMRPGYEPGWAGLYDLSAHREAADTEMAVGSFLHGGAPAPALPAVAAGKEERGRRLLALMSRKSRLAPVDVRNILTDTYSATADRFMPVFLSILEDNPVASARLTRIYFQNWKWRMKTDFVAPSVFNMLLSQFVRETCADELKDMTDPVMGNWPLLAPRFFEIVSDPRSGLFDDRTTYKTEYRDVIFDRAFLKTMRYFNRSLGPDMNKWNWGNLRRAHFRIPGRDTLFAREQEDLSWPGGYDTLLLGGMGPDLAPAEVTSLSGTFSIEESLIFMNFACSTNPNSRFYSGRVGRPGMSGFHEVRGVYVTEILPVK